MPAFQNSAKSLKAFLKGTVLEQRIISPDNEYLELTKSGFRKIDSNLGNQSISYVDSGICTLLESPSILLALARVAKVHYCGSEKTKDMQTDEGTIEIRQINDTLLCAFNGFYSAPKELSINVKDASLTTGDHLVRPTQALGVCRKLLEYQFAISKAENESEIICMDGNLEINEKSLKKPIRDLLGTLEKKSILCALSKTSSLSTCSGYPLGPLLKKFGPKSPWYYTLETKTKKEFARFPISFHAASPYVFYLDLPEKGKDKINQVACALYHNSQDAALAGYPYGLYMADRLARISEHEKREQRMRLLSRLGDDAEELQSLERSQDFHSVLDSISF